MSLVRSVCEGGRHHAGLRLACLLLSVSRTIEASGLHRSTMGAGAADPAWRARFGPLCPPAITSSHSSLALGFGYSMAVSLALHIAVTHGGGSIPLLTW